VSWLPTLVQKLNRTCSRILSDSVVTIVTAERTVEVASAASLAEHGQATHEENEKCIQIQQHSNQELSTRDAVDTAKSTAERQGDANTDAVGAFYLVCCLEG
jgi:(p)ppGpp synthase/HD superfamily hydrolase